MQSKLFYLPSVTYLDKTRENNIDDVTQAIFEHNNNTITAFGMVTGSWYGVGSLF